MAYNDTIMTQPTPKEKFVITHPRDENGEEVRFSFMLTLSKRLSLNFGTKEKPDTVEMRLIKAIGLLEGIDNINPDMGRYTIAATIARTFDPDEVIAEMKRRLENDVLSEIIRPSLVTP